MTKHLTEGYNMFNRLKTDCLYAVHKKNKKNSWAPHIIPDETVPNIIRSEVIFFFGRQSCLNECTKLQKKKLYIFSSYDKSLILHHTRDLTRITDVQREMCFRGNQNIPRLLSPAHTTLVFPLDCLLGAVSEQPWWWVRRLKSIFATGFVAWTGGIRWLNVRYFLCSVVWYGFERKPIRK